MILRNKIFTALGILLVIVTIGSYFLFDANIKQNSQAMGVNIVIAKENIPEGTIIRSVQEANKYFGVKRIAQTDAVPSSIRVNVKQTSSEGNILDRIRKTFVPEVLEIADADLQALVNKKITTDIYKNQQVLNIYLSNDLVEFEEDERYFAVPTNYIDSVGAEISKDDYVDLWVHYGSKHEKEGTSEKVIEALKVVKVKGANNEELKGDSGSVPSLVIFKMSEEQISVVSKKMHEGSLFLTKWGRRPETGPTITVKEKIEEENKEDEGMVIEGYHVEERGDEDEDVDEMGDTTINEQEDVENE